MLKDDNVNFTSTGYTVGEIMLFSYMHQMYLIMAIDMFVNTPKLKIFYAKQSNKIYNYKINPFTYKLRKGKNIKLKKYIKIQDGVNKLIKI